MRPGPRTFCLILVAAGALVLAAPAGAVVYHVNSAADTTGGCAGSGTCTLRGALDASNTGVSDDEIVLRAERYNIGSPLAAAAMKGKLTISGVSARTTVIDANDTGTVFTAATGAVVALNNLTMTDGKAQFSSGNVSNAGTATLTNVAVTAGEAPDGGGGLSNTGTLTLVNSLVSANTSGQTGGGIDTIKLSAQNPGVLNLINSTVSGNTTTGAGGALIAGTGSTVTLVNSTVASNTAGGSNGDGLHMDGGAATLKNSILALNDTRDCFTTNGGTVTSQGGNLAGSTCTGVGSTANPLLGPLANNGGQTDTRALLAGSPAIDAGTAPGCLSTDQRGLPRPVGKACDSGAFEVQPPPLVVNPVPDVAPTLGSVSATNKTFAVDARGQATARRKRRVPRGTTFRFRLSESASVRFVIEQRTTGRRMGKRCRKATRNNRSRKKCVRFVKVDQFTRAGKAGANRVAFSGRVRKGRRIRNLRPGRYRATLRATDAGGKRSKLKRLNLRIVKR